MPTKVTHTHKNTKWRRKPLTKRQTRNRLVPKLQNVDFRLSFDSNDANKNGFPSFVAVVSRLLLYSTYFSNSSCSSSSSYFIRLSGWKFFLPSFLPHFHSNTKVSVDLIVSVTCSQPLLVHSFRVCISCTHFWKPKNFLQKHQTKCDRLSNRSERVNMYECVWMCTTQNAI